MKHVLGGMSFPELLIRSIHAESTCLLQGHQVRILTYLYKKKSFLSRFVLSIKSLNEKVILSKFCVVYLSYHLEILIYNSFVILEKMNTFAACKSRVLLEQSTVESGLRRSISTDKFVPSNIFI